MSAAVGKWPLVVDRRAWIKRKPLSNQYAVHIPHTWLDEKPPTAHIAYTVHTQCPQISEGRSLTQKIN